MRKEIVEIQCDFCGKLLEKDFRGFMLEQGGIQIEVRPYRSGWILPSMPLKPDKDVCEACFTAALVTAVKYQKDQDVLS